VAQLAEAHAGCHHAGVVHRDVKPTRRALSGGKGRGRDEEGARGGVGEGRREGSAEEVR